MDDNIETKNWWRLRWSKFKRKDDGYCWGPFKFYTLPIIGCHLGKIVVWFHYGTGYKNW